MEVTAVLVLVGLLAAGGGAALGEAVERGRLRAASRELAMTFRRARTDATLGARNVAVVFDARLGYAHRYCVDGNGNGVRSAEMRSGVDPCIAGPVRLADRYPGVEIAIRVPPPVPAIPPDGGDLGDLGDPVRFGRTDIVSFSPLGSCSPGTVYLSAGPQFLAAVRLEGTTGRVRLFEYAAARGAWERR